MEQGRYQLGPWRVEAWCWTMWPCMSGRTRGRPDGAGEVSPGRSTQTGRTLLLHVTAYRGELEGE